LGYFKEEKEKWMKVRFAQSRSISLLILGLGLSLLYTQATHATEQNHLGESLFQAAAETSDPTMLALGEATPGNPMETPEAISSEEFESDPWEGFNEVMFNFNRNVLDRFILKPAATAWDFVLPDPVQRGFHNLFDNLAVVRRVVNNALQLKLGGAGKEVARFAINSTVGVAGLFDVARDGFGIEQSDEDMGQTFGWWGAAPGPFLVLPFLPPLTVRDGIGYAIDSAMTPYIYFLPWYATTGGSAVNIVNERSLNLDRFERVAESTVDLYGAVRNAYLQRRAAAVRQ
jgi:phospholipid-binding lipoprotein MlaA